MATHHRTDDLRRQFRYEAWANARVQALLAAHALPPKALQVWSHLITAKRTWISRLLGEETGALALWAVFAADDAGRQLAEAEARWADFLAGLSDGELARVVTFHNSKGQPQADAVGDILHQVLTHSAYHRGQIAAVARAAGIDPPLTDFIVFAREEHAEPAPGMSGKLSAADAPRR